MKITDYKGRLLYEFAVPGDIPDNKDKYEWFLDNLKNIYPEEITNAVERLYKMCKGLCAGFLIAGKKIYDETGRKKTAKEIWGDLMALEPEFKKDGIDYYIHQDLKERKYLVQETIDKKGRAKIRRIQLRQFESDYMPIIRE